MASEHEKELSRIRQKRYREKHAKELMTMERVRNAAESRAGYKAAHYQEHKRERPFVGVDGEGRTLENGYHAYFMLRAGNETIYPRNGEKRLRSTDVLQFLSNLQPDNTYVSYVFDYDVAKCLEDVPWERLHRLIHPEQRKHKDTGRRFPVDWNRFQFDWMPHKEFKVRMQKNRAWHHNDAEWGSWITINDTGGFFQGPFIDTLEAWQIGTDEERAKIQEGKNLRGEFSEISDEYIDEYNALECKLLAELMEQFRDICQELGYVPRKWQGAGQLAEAILAKHGIPKTKELEIFQGAQPDDSVASFGRYAYYGGRFETSLVGYTPIPCLQFDINNAYPYALQHVPCLLHGTWIRKTGKRKLSPDELSLSFGSFRWERGSKRSFFMGFPIRLPDGSIRFPYSGKGWYWSFEARSAIHQSYTVFDSWVYEKKCDCRPFDFLRDIYRERKRLGKSAKGKMLKLGANSVYGKLVQSIGSPQYANPILASFITAWVRTMINDAIHSMPACKDPKTSVPCGSDVYMVATDAVFTAPYEATALDIGPELGQWERTEQPNGLMIVQPGVYFDPIGDDGDSVYKTRGMPKKKVVEHKQEFIDAYWRMVREKDVKASVVHLPFSLFIGIRQALQHKNTKLLGQWKEYKDPETGELGRRVSFEWQTKRRPEPLPPSVAETLTGKSDSFLRTLPYSGMTDEKEPRPIQTTPYSKDIGGIIKREEMRIEFDNQPDWVNLT